MDLNVKGDSKDVNSTIIYLISRAVKKIFLICAGHLVEMF